MAGPPMDVWCGLAVAHCRGNPEADRLAPPPAQRRTRGARALPGSQFKRRRAFSRRLAGLYWTGFLVLISASGVAARVLIR